MKLSWRKVVLKKGIGVMALVSICLAFNACAAALIGMGTAGGYAYSKSRHGITGYTDRSFEKVWVEAKDALRKHGVIKEQDMSQGFIRGETKYSNVKINIVQVTQSSLRVTVEANKLNGLLGDFSTAEKIFKSLSDLAVVSTPQ